jgi:excinuclease ABC subunit C
MPSLVLIDGGLGQLYAAAQALEALEIINQSLAAIAKREEIIYNWGQENEPWCSTIIFQCSTWCR